VAYAYKHCWPTEEERQAALAAALQVAS